MNYLSLIFPVFIAIFLIIYYLVKPEYRYIVLFVGSCFFYGYSHYMFLLVLLGITLLTYFGGLAMDGKRTRGVYALFFLLEILVLAVFKYTGFVLESMNSVLSRFSLRQFNADLNIVLPVGLSFIIFQACNYLSDVYRERIVAEKNIIRLGAYVAFFPTVLSGPIQKARNLLPQIRSPKLFEYEQAQKGVILFAWGAFEKIMVANRLSVVHTRVIGDYINHSSAEILIAAISFSLYIYADFSAYSDMARGIAKLLGIDVGRNFINPYLSSTTAEFWRRWHVSLNEWLTENIYIPLGGNRKGSLRKYINILIVFAISGLWHGANWHFVVWGVLNGVLVVTGLILSPVKSAIYDKMGVDEHVEGILLLRRILVFWFITLTWVFFSSGVMEAFGICKKIIMFDLLSIFDQGLFSVAGTVAGTFATAIATMFFLWIQCKRRDESGTFKIYRKQPFLLQCVMMAVLICICIFGACSTDANVDTAFLYFKF